ncbi:hypothetical protein [Methylorubrum extorquens]|nr:hypothetical protein [Methylorubrum extorquens]UYW26968.1 hypothetical protein OKC48_27775 [Methylorubrum extorquens]WIU40547.1 hypothetical protein KQ926_04205 [Methylorubrum extorquens]
MKLSERHFLQAMCMRHETWINRRSPHVAAVIHRAKLKKASCSKSKNKSLPHNDNVIELALPDKTGRSLFGSGAPQPSELGAQLTTAIF